jgi:hypothetical protein
VIRCEEGFICAGEIILSSKWINANDDAVVLATVRRLTEISNHPFLAETSPGIMDGHGSIEEFFDAFDASQVKSASLQRKQALSEVRRREFSLLRPEIELALIHRDGYVCAHTDCKTMTGLTVDHIVPLSKGGTDDLMNLRLLCRSHNSAKGDR